MFYRNLLFPLLCALSHRDAEVAHELALQYLRLRGSKPLRRLMRSYAGLTHYPQRIWGIHFPNPLGLAAGFDKNGVALHGLASLGFGFLECGTVVLQPQQGNPRPRLFRLREDRSLINRMGFNSEGLIAVKVNLEEAGPLPIPLGINVGKNKDTPNERAHEEYAALIEALWAFAAYFVANVSSPNTAGLRDLQEYPKLVDLISACRRAMRTAAGAGMLKPLLVKVAPDLSFAQFDDVLKAVQDAEADGLIIGNTASTEGKYMPRGLLSKHRREKGGFSGPRVHARAVEMVAYAHRHLPNLAIIGVGGIQDIDGAKRMQNAGARLLQMLTGFIFGGPSLPRKLVMAL